MRFTKVYDLVIERLKNEIPASVAYHNYQHTINVLEHTIYLAENEQIGKSSVELLKTAALFHDTGFIFDPKSEGHELRSRNFAQEILPDYGFSEEDIDLIGDLIMATKLPQNPQNKLQEIICDADLYYLGTDRYLENSDKLVSEFRADGRAISDAKWCEIQVDFLSRHHFFTPTAKKDLEIKKRKNLKKIEQKMKNMTKQSETSKLQGYLQEYLLIVVGVLIAAVALKGFLVPNHFFDGGVTGLSLLIHELYHINLALVIVLMNIPLIIIGYFTVGKAFTIKTFVAVVLLGIVLQTLPVFDLTHDKLLISIFGGVFLGLGVGLNMRAGAALDGIEVLALYTLKRTSFTITEIILGINIIIFSVAAFKFGVETALYSCLTYFAASRTIDYVVEGLQAFTGVTIISSESQLIKHELVNNLKRGITVYKGERGFLPESFEVSADCDIIFTVITRFELRKLKNLIYEVDPNAFVFANTIKEASGGIISRKQHH
ncbi:MAG: YitT family protein [Leadbetterella sp.]|nr:YitT family protein [Leadbetterella sp.]